MEKNHRFQSVMFMDFAYKIAPIQNNIIIVKGNNDNGGGLVVSVIAFYPSLNHADV